MKIKISFLLFTSLLASQSNAEEEKRSEKDKEVITQITQYVPKIEDTPKGEITSNNSNNFSTLSAIEAVKTDKLIADKLCEDIKNTENYKNQKIFIYDSETISRINKSNIFYKEVKNLNQSIFESINTIKLLIDKDKKTGSNKKSENNISSSATSGIAITAGLTALYQLYSLFKSDVTVSTNNFTDAKSQFISILYANKGCNEIILKTKKFLIPSESLNSNANIFNEISELKNSKKELDELLSSLKKTIPQKNKNISLQNFYDKSQELSTNTGKFLNEIYDEKDQKKYIPTQTFFDLLLLNDIKNSYILDFNITQENSSIVKKSIFGSTLRVSSSTIFNYSLYDNESKPIKHDTLYISSKPTIINLKQGKKPIQESDVVKRINE